MLMAWEVELTSIPDDALVQFVQAAVDVLVAVCSTVLFWFPDVTSGWVALPVRTSWILAVLTD